jgi:RNA polymerase sigma factor (sigma-70 family)
MHRNNWHKIYTQQSPKLLGICRRYIKDTATAEDIVQDAFIVAIQKENDLKHKNALNGWLSRIVINKALNHLKYKNKFNFTSSENIEFVDETGMTTTSELDRKSAILASDFTQRELLDAIDSLSENHKSVFNLYIIDQFSHLEISKVLQISVGTSKSSLSRARKNIQEFLAQKLSVEKIEEKKKRRLLFLLILGLGNKMFAQKFRKSFDSFEIQPNKLLDLSRNVNDTSFEFVPKASHFTTYMGVAALAVMVSFVVIINFYREEATSPIQKNTLEVETVLNAAIVDSLNKNEVKSTTIPEQKKEVNQDLIPIKSQATISKSSISNDTIPQKKPQKVIVITKKIIKKDTIYVQK